MILDILKDAILANIGLLRPAPKGWFKRHCPLCHSQGHGKDTRNRFGIQFNADSIAANCFNCGFSAGYTEGNELSKSFKFLLKQLHIPDRFVEEIEFDIFRNINQLKTIREGEIEVTIEDKESKFKSLFDKWHPMDLPKDALSITEWLEYGLDDPSFLKVVDYALNRKIYDLDKFFWSPDTSHNVNQRLIIPYYYRNRIVGFTARLSYDTDGKSIPKYYQQLPTDFVYNLDHQQFWNRKYVILNEGVLDAWTTDGISSLGELGQTKIDIINRLQKQIIVCPDRDKKGGDLVDAAIENDWAVSFPKWDNGIKDAARAAETYGRLLTIHSIIEAAITGRVKIKLGWDIEHRERNRKRK